MQYRPLGRTGLHVSVIGLGTWAWGGMWGPRDDRAALDTLHRALELGVNFIDTALIYGDGHSESVIGRGLRRLQPQRPIYVASKIPPRNMHWPALPETPLRDAFPADWILRCTERSLRALGRDYLDVQQLHVWSATWLRETEWIETLQRLQRDGKIRHIGVSINDHEPDTALDLVRSGWIDTVQVIYNIFDQTPAERLLPLCAEQGVGVIVRVPFDEGGLTGSLTRETVFHHEDWRGRYFAGNKLDETVDRVDALRPVLAAAGSPSVPHGALRFCVHHPAVSTVIPGMRSITHVEANSAATDAPPLDAATLQMLRAHAWPRNFYAGVW